MPSFEMIIGDKVIDLTKDVKKATNKKEIKKVLIEALRESKK